jgi:hypothetical protein
MALAFASQCVGDWQTDKRGHRANKFSLQGGVHARHALQLLRCRAITVV